MLGIIGILLSWVPIVNNVAAIISIAGLVFGIIGIVKTGRKGRKRGRGLAIAGVVLSVIAIILALATQNVYSGKTAESQATSASASGEKDDLKACKLLMGDDMKIMTDMPTLITSIGDKMTSEQQGQLKETHLKIEKARKVSESGLSGHLASLDTPFKQAYDVMGNGGGSIDMDTSHMANDITNVMGDCANAGYKISKDAAASSDASASAGVDDATPSVPTEYTNALTKAEQYSDSMQMSKQGIYDQLTSPNGEKFSADAAQYAVDNLKADYNASALAKAKTYESQMSMSPEAIREQLTSDSGERFTQSEADYAIAHLND